MRNKSTLVVLAVVMLVLLMSVSRAPVQLLPHIEQNQLIVTTLLSGADAEQMEQTITTRQEQVLRQLKGIAQFTSVSEAGKTTITVGLENGVDPDLISSTIANTLNTAIERTSDMVGPTITLPPRQAAAWYFLRGIDSLEAHNPTKIDQLANTLAAGFKDIKGIEDVRLVGKPQSQILVSVDPERLAVAGVTLEQVQTHISQATGQSVGYRNIAGRKYRIKVEDEGVLTRLRQSVLYHHDGMALTLGDIAKIEVVRKERDLNIYSLGELSVAFRIQVAKDANLLDTLGLLQQKVDRLNETLLQSKGMRLTKSFDAATYLDKALGNVMSSFLLGLLLCSVLVLMLSRSIAQTGALIATVVASLLLTFGLVYLCGGAFNLVTLAGITLSVGLALDNAIIVYDNLLSADESARKQNKPVVEILPALFGSTVTSLIVLIPVFMIDGYISALFQDLALALGASLLASFVVSLVLLPALLKSTRFVDNPPTVSGDSRLLSLVTPKRLSVQGRSVMMVVAVAALAGAMWLFWPKTNLLPNAKWDQINVLFRIPNNYTLTHVEAKLGSTIRERVKQVFAEDKRVKNYYLMMAPSFGQLGIRLHDVEDAEDVIEVVKAKVFAGGDPVSPIVRRSAIFSSFNESGALTLVLSNNDIQSLTAAQNDLKAALEQAIEGARVTLSDTMLANLPTVSLALDEQRLVQTTMDRQGVMNFVKGLSDGRYVAKGFVDGEVLDINLSLDSWRHAEQIPHMPLSDQNGEVGRLGNFVQMSEFGAVARYHHINGIRGARLNVFLPEDMAIESGLDKINEVIDKVQPTTDTVIGWSPQVQQELDAKKQMIMALAVAGLLVFSLFVVLYESLTLSLIIMVTAPVAVIGGAISLWFSDLFGLASGDLLSLFAYLVLIGVSVNNSLLLIQKVQALAPNRDNLVDVVRRALADRMRPILLTTLTSVLGMLPFVFGGVGAEMFKGLALVIIGGLLLSVLATSFLVTNLIVIFAGEFVGDKETYNELQTA